MWDSATNKFLRSEEICQQKSLPVLVLDSQVNAFD